MYNFYIFGGTYYQLTSMIISVFSLFTSLFIVSYATDINVKYFFYWNLQITINR